MCWIRAVFTLLFVSGVILGGSDQSDQSLSSSTVVSVSLDGNSSLGLSE